VQPDREISVKRPTVLVLFFTSFFISCSTTKRETGEPANTPAAAMPEPDLRPVIVAFGDSLTAGAGVQPAMNYPAKLQAKIDASGYRYRVVNAGVSGDTSSQGLNRVQSVVSLHPAIVIVEFGANDGLRGIPADTTTRNLVAIISRLQSSGAKVVLAGMLVPPNYGPIYANSFRNIFPNVAKKTGAVLLPFFLDGVGGHPELNQEDGIHPTAEGYDNVVEKVWKVLKPILD
jgi:acyl-CoA thioesterase-1